jgi:hypothetical protein
LGILLFIKKFQFHEKGLNNNTRFDIGSYRRRNVPLYVRKHIDIAQNVGGRKGG